MADPAENKKNRLEKNVKEEGEEEEDEEYEEDISKAYFSNYQFFLLFFSI